MHFDFFLYRESDKFLGLTLVLAIVWGLLFLFDTSLFFATLWKAVRLWKSVNGSLVQILLRDGECPSLI